MNKNIIELFKLKGARVDKIRVQKDILVFVRNQRKSAKCPRCGDVCSVIHQKKTRKVVHQIFDNKKVILMIKVRRFKCRRCAKPFTEQNLPGIANKRYSQNFQLTAIEELRNCSFKTVAGKYKVSSPTLVNFLRERQKEVKWSDSGEIVLNVDEHSYSGMDMKLTIGDLKRKRLIAILKDRKQTTLTKFFRNAPDEVKQRISEVCIDMNHSYRSVIEQELPNAKIVVDKFHVIRELLRQMEEVRKIIQEENSKEKRINRFLLLKNQEDLSVVERLKLKMAFEKYKMFPALKNCYWVKEKMREIYKCKNFKIAEYKFDLLIKMLENERVGKLKEIRGTLKRWRPCILNYFHNGTTNAFIEGVNNKIKLIKRISYGFRNFENYVLKITLAFLPFLFLSEKWHTIV